MGMTPKFDNWFAKLKKIADEKNFPLGDKESYRDYFEDGYTPAETLAEEMQAAG